MSDPIPHFDAAAASPSDETGLSETIRELNERVAEAELEASLEGTLAMLEAIEASLDSEPLEPLQLQALTDVTGEDAPAGFRRLRDLVDRGVLTWQQVWDRPMDHGQVGLDLIMAVVAWTATAVQEQEAAEAAERDALDRGPGGLDGPTGTRTPRRD